MSSSPPSITFDTALPIRAVPFESLRNLLVSISPHVPVRYTDALRMVVEQGVILSLKSEGATLKKTAFYHYWTALRLLGLIEQTSTRLYDITPRGQRLIKSASEDPMFLSEEEKAIFREGMLASQEIWNNFFVLFTGSRTPNAHPSVGSFVAFTPLPPKMYKKAKYRRYAIRSSYFSHLLIPDDSRVYHIIVGGLRRWGQQCDLVDEIFPPTTMRTFKDITSFMYLVDVDRERRLARIDFTSIIEKYRHIGERLFESTVRFSIPELLTWICLQEGIRLVIGQQLLGQWVQQHRHDVALERPSIGLVEEQRGTRRADSRAAFHQTGAGANERP